MKAKSAAKAVFVLVLSSFLAPMCSAGASQQWHLTDYEPTGAAGIRSMNCTTGPMEGSADVSLTTGGRIWIADYAASASVDMSGDWQPNIVLEYSADGSGARTVTVQIGKWSESAGFSRCSGTGTTLQISPGETKTYSSAMQTTGHVINAGERLALKIYLNSSAGGYVLAKTANPEGPLSQSSITSPLLDEGYPTPELPSILLASAGICIIALISRRRR